MTNKTKSSSVPSAPGCDSNSDNSILQVRNLRKWFNVKSAFRLAGRDIYGSTSWLKAVDDVSFDIEYGKTFGLVGESGCGKTTTGKLILQLEKLSTDGLVDAGKIFFKGEDLKNLSDAGRKEYRTSIQAVFQDPWSSLNPRMRVRDVIGEPLKIATKMTKSQINSRVSEVLEEVGLHSYQSNLFPHEFSGGQRQRISHLY